MSHKIALITGGSRGLGRNAALQLARQGVDILFTYRSGKTEADNLLTQLQSMGIKAAAFELDTTRIAQFPEFARQITEALQTHWQRQQFDCLVNNAGVGIHAAFADTTEAQFDALMNVHLKGVFFLTQALLPLISDGGRILNISTGLTRFTQPGYAAYAAMKGGVEVLTRYLAKELGARGISVNSIAPGAIETDFGGGIVRDNPQVNHHLAQATALGRVGLPDDIGKVIAMLLSTEAGWINAQRIEASGGMFI